MRHREVCLLTGRDGESVRSDPSDSAVPRPASRGRRGAGWRLREGLRGLGHSHPLGPRGFRPEDETTMEAPLLALGRPVRCSVVAPEGTLVREHGQDRLRAEEPAWTAELRARSGMATA